MDNNKIDKILQNKKVKPTAMRELILDELSKKPMAISLKELEDRFAQSEKSTLYRTLKTFEEKKIIHSVDDGTGSIKYAACHDTCMCNLNDLHIHFHCTECKQTYCLPKIPIPEIALPEGYTHKKTNFVVKGICRDCQN